MAARSTGAPAKRRWGFSLAARGPVAPATAPVGYVTDQRFDDSLESVTRTSKDRSNTRVIEAQAWAMSKSQVQPFFMNCFMMWMVGNQLNLWVILTVGYAVVRGVTGVLQVGSAFSKFPETGVDLTVPKLAYAGTQLANLAVAVYKIGTMGLLPLTSADWVSLLPVRQAVEVSAAALS